MPKILNSVLTFVVFLVGLINFQTPIKFIIAATIAIAAVFAINFLGIKISKQEKKYYWQLVMPTLFVMGLFGTLASISSFYIKAIVDLIASGIFYYYQANFLIWQTPEVDQEFFTLTVGLLVLIPIWSLNFFFHFPGWVTTLSVSLCFSLIFIHVFYKINVPSKFLWALVSVLILVELNAAVFYWPVHFFTATVIVFSGFYLLYVLTVLYYSHRLTAKRIYFHTALAFAVAIGAVSSSMWGI